MQNAQRRATAIASVIAFVGLYGCHKTAQTADGGDTPAVSASASADMAASVAPDDTTDDGGVTTLTPPAALVQADSNIPINEAVVGAPTNLPADYSADTAPPPQAVVETEPTQPDSTDVWVPGYWWWSRPLGRYVWVGGAWRQPPQDQTWVAGSWTPHSGRYVWSPGYWGPRGYAREFVDVAPPPARFETRPAAPGAEFVWTPGYYEHRGGAYAWNAGTWTRPPRAGVTWVEPRYVTTGGRYFLQPGRWDVPVERRGVVYAPDINARPGARITLAPVPANVVVEHARFVNESSRAVAHGIARDEHGGFVVPHAVIREHVDVHVDEHVRVDEHVHVDEHADPHARVEEHVDPHARVEEHVDPHARVEEHVDPRVHVEQHAADPRGHTPEAAHVEAHVAAPRVDTRVEVRQQNVQPHPTATTNNNTHAPEQHDQHHH